MTTPDGGLLGAPAHELERSEAARAIGRMARASGLFAAHFEHRLELPLPEWWQVPHADLGPYPWEPEGGWRAGSLHETKFRTFRLDRRIGSFHPAHAAKWSTHELCHGLVGFGWRPGASVLWTATAARLAELVPVALWYFFDEAGLARCPRHQGQGALFGPACPACEQRAANEPGLVDGADVRLWRQRGRAFVEAEIDAAWQTLHSGVPVSNRHGTLDLSTDGLAYARAHGPVLSDPLFAAWVERFCTVDRGWHDDLDSLVGRARDVVAALCREGDAEPLEGHAATWMAQDLGWRLVQLRAEVDGEVAHDLDGIVDTLAEAASRPDLPSGLAGVDAAMGAYEALFEDVVLPEPADMFAVGYPLPRGYGSSRSQLQEGLEATLPLTCARLGAGLSAAVEAFVTADPWVRQGLGDRFATWARENVGGAIADQAMLEAALMHVSAPDPVVIALQGEPAADARWTVAAHVRPMVLHHDVGTDPADPGTGEAFDEPVHVAVERGLDGTRELVALDGATGPLLLAAQIPRTTEFLGAAGRALVEAGFVVPNRWARPDGDLA
jgi:hypothetical protein